MAPADPQTTSEQSPRSAPAEASATEEPKLPPQEQQEQQEADEEEEVVVTLAEVLQQDTLLSEAADAVLGASSETDCSYPLGYIRQALYACLTCTPAAVDDDAARAGVCLACSYNCHENHELVELYTKRHFRCDCGNAKFPSANPCKLVNDKAPRNEQNAYSQNFAGKYCTCHRPYPDPERTTEEVMLQCVVCEDWLHDEHVFPAAADGDGDARQESVPGDFDDFICLACMEKHPFLLAYDMDDDDDDANEGGADAADQTVTTEPQCVLEKKLQAMEASEHAAELKKARPTFWSREWRDALCKCRRCVARFETAHIAFLLDPEDSLQAYEEAAAARASRGSVEDLAARAFSSALSHEQQVEMAIGYSTMKNSLQEYLAGFAAGNKTVRAEDIQSFFEDLRAKKRHRNGADE